MAMNKVIVYLLSIMIPLAIVLSQDIPEPPPGPGDDLGDGDHQDRLFFSPIRLVSCNFTAEPGRTCRSCFEAVRCLPSGAGVLSQCRGLLRYCNQGRCSLTPGAACTNFTG